MAIVTDFDGFVSLSCHEHLWEAEAQQDTNHGENGHEKERGIG